MPEKTPDANVEIEILKRDLENLETTHEELQRRIDNGEFCIENNEGVREGQVANLPDDKTRHDLENEIESIVSQKDAITKQLGQLQNKP